MATAGNEKPQRDTYRHGDLRNALIEAALELARQGGAEAIVLRAATRQAGVVPNAAYRHFADRDALLHAVSQAAMAQVARTMEAEQAALLPTEDPVSAAPAPSSSPGPPSTDSPSCSLTAPSGASTPPRPTTPASTSST